MASQVCDIKIPEEKRHGGAFELTLQSWLALYFVPTFTQLLKEKKKGNISATITIGKPS